MVRPTNVARSRACEQCRRKRIKCDLNSPCERCIESSLPCSGPISGLIIVNTDPTTFSKPQTKKPRNESPVPAANAGLQIIPAPIKSPELGTNVYDEVLLGKFLTYFSQSSGGRAWAARLPILIAAKNRVAMRTAARAVSLAFAAQAMQNASMARIARECYGTSLRYHQFSFKAPAGKTIDRKKAANALPVTVLLSYYELINATSQDAWLKHTLAAERLFVLLGPESLEEPLLNHLFFIIRANAVIRYMLDGAETSLLDDMWSNVGMLAPCGPGTVVLHALLSLAVKFWRKVKEQLVTSCDDEVTELNSLWAGFMQELGCGLPRTPFVIPWTNPGFGVVSPYESGLPRIPDYMLHGGTALAESFFQALAILAIAINNWRRVPSFQEPSSISATDSAYPHFVSIEDDRSNMLHHHAARILTLSQYQRSLKVGCANLRMVLPLTVVNRFGYDMEQRLMAEELFREWCGEDGLFGLADFAFGQKGVSENTSDMIVQSTRSNVEVYQQHE